MSAINPGGVGFSPPPESPRNRSIGLSDRTEAGPSFQQAAMSDEFLKAESIQGDEDQYASTSSRMSSPNHSDAENQEKQEERTPVAEQLSRISALFQAGKYSEVMKISPKVETRLLREKRRCKTSFRT